MQCVQCDCANTTDAHFCGKCGAAMETTSKTKNSISAPCQISFTLLAKIALLFGIVLGVINLIYDETPVIGRWISDSETLDITKNSRCFSYIKLQYNRQIQGYTSGYSTNYTFNNFNKKITLTNGMARLMSGEYQPLKTAPEMIFDVEFSSPTTMRLWTLNESGARTMQYVDYSKEEKK